MSRRQQSQNIDRLIQGIDTVAQNRCSLSGEDLKILTEAMTLLRNLKQKKGKTNKEVLVVLVQVVELLAKFFKNDSDN